MMTELRFVFAGQGRLVWSTHPQEILQQMANYVHYEGGLMSADQVAAPTFETMHRLRNELRDLMATASNQEGIRSDARDAYDTTLHELKDKSRRAIVLLKGKHYGHWQRLQRWGLEVVETAVGTQVRIPRSRAQWVRFFTRYLEEEAGLPASDRIDEPALDEMQTLWEQVQHHEQIWRTAWQERQIAIEQRNQKEKECLMSLKWALTTIVMEQYKGVLRQEVERWGFRLVLPVGKDDAD